MEILSFFFNKTSVITYQTLILIRKFWRLLEDVFCLRLLDLLIKTNIFDSVICLQKTSSRCFDQNEYIHLGDLSSRRFQDVFKTCCKNINMNIFILMICLQDFFESSRRLEKTSRYLQDVFKMLWRRFQNVLQRCLQDILRLSWGHIIKLNCSC